MEKINHKKSTKKKKPMPSWANLPYFKMKKRGNSFFFLLKGHCNFFFFWEMDSDWYINQGNENPPIQKTRYPMEHTPTKYERLNIVSLVGLRHELQHCLADVHERKKYSLVSLKEIHFSLSFSIFELLFTPWL